MNWKVEKLELSFVLAGSRNWSKQFEKFWTVPSNLNVKFDDPAIPLLDAYPTEMSTYTHQKTDNNVRGSFIHSPKCPPTEA